MPGEIEEVLDGIRSPSCYYCVKWSEPVEGEEQEQRVTVIGIMTDPNEYLAHEADPLFVGWLVASPTGINLIQE